jgi:predicted ABC-type transport system involved in lysophospholipase L1 biosynthesis ATPase subunit
MDDPRIVLADGPTRNPRASAARQVMAPLFTLVNEPREALVVGKHDGSLRKRGDAV